MLRGRQGYSLVEFMIGVLILSIFFAGGYAILSAGRSVWATVDTHIALQESLRRSFQKMSGELRQSDTAHLTVAEAVGPNSSDRITFSIPVLCHAGDTLLDGNGDVAHWGAPLTWGCTQSTCMDADNDCSSRDYAWIVYQIYNGSLVRRVLAGNGGQVREDVVAENMLDFQAQTSGNVVRVDITVQQKSVMGRTMTTSLGENIFLRN